MRLPSIEGLRDDPAILVCREARVPTHPPRRASRPRTRPTVRFNQYSCNDPIGLERGISGQSPDDYNTGDGRLYAGTDIGRYQSNYLTSLKRALRMGTLRS